MAGGVIQSRYEQLKSGRDPYLRRGRKCSELTIPTLLPPEGSSGSTTLPTPYQSLGARGVNNLSAKLLLTVFPPNAPFFRFLISDYMLEKLTGQEGMRAAVEEALDRMERSVMVEIETTHTRTPMFEGLKQLVVVGNVLIYMLPKGGIKTFRLDRYVCKRDPSGNPLEMITEEHISLMEVPEMYQEQVAGIRKAAGEKSPEDNIPVYTRIRLQNGRWEVDQEVAGVSIPEATGHYPKDKSPWLPLRFFAVDGEDYGRGYVEEYLGDLISYEELCKAIVEGSAAAAKVLILVKANATTKQKDIAEAPSGAVRTGNAEDVSVVQLEKYADFRVALETIARIEERLSFAFLLNTAIQRNAERVTAEEIRYMANELETALGGTYSVLGHELQLPFVTRMVFQMERQGKIPRLPTGSVKPMIVTGVEALGRGQDLTRLSGFLTDLAPLGPEAIATYINVADFIKRMGSARGIDMKGLIPTEEEIAERQQQQQMQSMAEKLGPNAINQVGAMARDQQSAGLNG